MSDTLQHFDEAFLEGFNCPVCLRVPEAEIFQCINGHSVCGSCCADETNCALCRASFVDGKIRNRSLENLISFLQVACPYSDSGCQKILKRRDLESHKRNCTYNGKFVKFCKILGLDCDQWSNSAKPEDVFAHLTENHTTFIRENGSTADFRLENLQGIEQKQNSKNLEDSMWSTILLQFYYQKWDEDIDEIEEENRQYFAIVTKLNKADFTISWFCIHISDEVNATDQIEVEFNIEAQTDQVPVLKWKTRPISILEAAEVVPYAPFRFPISLLAKHYACEETGSILVSMSVEKVSDEYDVTDVIIPDGYSGHFYPISVNNPNLSKSDWNEKSNDQENEFDVEFEPIL